MKKKVTEDEYSYLIVGFTFGASGLLFMLNESSRSIAIPFLVLGITFLAIGNVQKLFTKK